MGFRPPKGVRPQQLEGKRTGRPKGSRNYAKVWADPLWGFLHRHQDEPTPPTSGAWLWWGIARQYPNEVGEFLEQSGQL
jgi:hypothetical protein